MSDNEKSRALLEKYFDTAFAAPEGIKKLRELILTLAMQGKLVPQDPSDQPASELLKEIEAEKRRLVKAGKIREQKLLPEIKPEERPYELPECWAWVRFGSIAQHNSGKTLDKSRNKGQYRDYITTSNLYWGYFELDNVRQMPIKDEEIEKCTARKGDLLICEGGEAGRAAVWFYDNEVCFQNHVHRARFYCDIDPYYGYRFFEKLNATGEINNYRQGVGISNMSGKVLASIALPLPPLAEQQRIVARIDQLMARCDELEKLRAEREAKRLTVHISALNRLFEAQGNDSFTDAWHFINRHFGELYSVKQNVTELRKAILQLGVMGKLVPQDPNDQPASELLKEIEAEKRRLVQEGKIKLQKPLPEIKSEEQPYVLPEGWEWVRLGSFCEKVSDGFHHTPKKISQGVRYVSATHIYNGRIDWNSGLYVSEEEYFELYKKTKQGYGDILIVNRGAGCGDAAVVDTDGRFCFQNAAIIGFSQNHVDGQYILCFLHASRKHFLEKFIQGGAQPMLSNKLLATHILALPPLAEQHRIVAKIDQLMALCDQLEQQIVATASKQSALLNVVMAKI